MRKFLLKTSLMIILLVGSFAYILSRADGYTDPFYLRFTTPKQKNLVIGTSRAAQGIQPAILKRVLNQDLYNYSFTIEDSPFGPAYLSSIKKKLIPKSKNGIFIVAVDPWSISSRISNLNDSLNFRELNRCVGNTSIVDINPNFIYLIKNLAGNYHKALFNRKKSLHLHPDGWLEASIKMDSTSVIKRINRKAIEYGRRRLPEYAFSSVRFDYLVKTIIYLKARGEVYLVKLPVHPKIAKIDIQLIPNFDEKILGITHLVNKYIDFSDQNDQYIYTDGSHLHKSSGEIISEKIANDILESRREKNFYAE